MDFYDWDRDRYMFLIVAVVVLVHIGVVAFAHCRWWKASKSMHACNSQGSTLVETTLKLLIIYVVSGVKQAENQLGWPRGIHYTVVRRQRVRPDRSGQAEKTGENKGSSSDFSSIYTSYCSVVVSAHANSLCCGLSTKNLIYKKGGIHTRNTAAHIHGQGLLKESYTLIKLNPTRDFSQHASYLH
jgi:hypothetical protein